MNMEKTYESVLDKVVREINTRRSYVPIIYIETEDRNLIFRILERKDCFVILEQDEEKNVLYLESTKYDSSFRKNKKDTKWENLPQYFVARDFQTWNSDNQREMIKKYMDEVIGNLPEIPLKNNLIIVSAVGISIGDEDGCCIPNGYEQFVDVIDVPLIGMYEFAEMIVEVQNKALKNIRAEEITIEDYLAEPDEYTQGFKGMNREQVRNILHKLQNSFGIVSYCGVPEKFRKISYEELEKEAKHLIKEQKKQNVSKSGEIEYLDTDQLVKPGGMKGLQEWIAKKKKILDYPERARLFGEKFPKGILIAGIPGSGKSLTAKYVAQELGIPLIRFKMDMVLQKYVGDSEQRLNKVLKLFEASAPVVIWIDEIEKEMAGMQGSDDGDSGVNKRILAGILGWMQENKERCFICATANHTESLPSELLRRGRFDRLYYTFLPMHEQCVEIMFNHMKKMKKDNPALFDDGITDKDLLKLCHLTFDEAAKYERKYFTGSDITGLIEDARSELFDDLTGSGEYSIDDSKKVIFEVVKNSLTYSETNFEGVLDYWLALKRQEFRNTAAPEKSNQGDKYEYMLFDFSDLQNDGKEWKWRKDLECKSKHIYDQKMFKVLTESILKRNTTQK